MAKTKRTLKAEEDSPFEDPIQDGLLEGELTPEELARVEKEAQEEVNALVKARLLKRAKEQAVIRAKVAAGLLPATADEGMSLITIDVAKFAPWIALDNRIYWHGYTYKVPAGVARTLLDQMYRTHGHQAEIDGKSRFEGAQRPRAVRISPRNPAGITTSRSLRGAQ